MRLQSQNLEVEFGLEHVAPPPLSVYSPAIAHPNSMKVSRRTKSSSVSNVASLGNSGLGDRSAEAFAPAALYPSNVAPSRPLRRGGGQLSSSIKHLEPPAFYERSAQWIIEPQATATSSAIVISSLASDNTLSRSSVVKAEERNT